MRGISFKGIVAGIIVTFVADTVAGLGLIVLLADGRPMDALYVSTPFLLGSLVLGTLTTVLGGYVAASVANARAYVNSGAIGVLGIILGALTAKSYPAWFGVLAFVSTVPAALLGGYLAKRGITSNA